jgi:DNA-binding winged helix-turn-helix (wHTH) protein/TolB-like protein
MAKALRPGSEFVVFHLIIGGRPQLPEVRLGSRTLQSRRQLLAGGERIPLGRRALDILSVLAEAGGEILTKDELFEAVWPGTIVEENALQVHVVALRKALGPDADRLETIRGVGYRLDIGVRNSDTPHKTFPSAAGDSNGVPEPLLSATAAMRRNSRGPNGRHPGFIGVIRSHRGLAVAVTVFAALALGGWALLTNGVWPLHARAVPVVVRSFATTTGSGTNDLALAGGITDELIVRLRRLPRLRVATAEPTGIPESGVFRDAYVVDGSIRSVGNLVRVTARLQKMDGEVLWSQTYDQGLADLLNVQEQIAAAIAGSLSVSFDIGADSSRFGGTDNPEAYAAYLEYRAHQLDADQSVPVRFLERALALDPHYVKALVALASSYGIRSNFAATRAQALALLHQMDVTTARAVAANPDSWIGHMARGNYHNERKDFAGAAKSFQRVTELDNGTDPELRRGLALYALVNGRAREALGILDSNEAIDPITRLDPIRILVLESMGRHTDAIALFDKLTASDPVSVQQYAPQIATAYSLLGQEAKAFSFAREHNVDMAGMLAIKSDTRLTSMSLNQLRQWANRRFGEARTVELASAAYIASHYGRPRLAVDLLRLDLERPGGFGVQALWHPAMANARKTNEFKRLVTDFGLVRFWRQSGRWPDACRPLSATDFTCT